MSKHLSDRQLAANRANAQKSTGPRTLEGKIRSSMNAWKHGITAQTVCLNDESAPQFERLLNSFRAHFQPVDDYELHIVDRIAVIHWHMDRLRFMESALLQAEMFRPNVIAPMTKVGPELLPACAFRFMADHANVLSLFNSQLNRLSRESARLHETFLKMRKDHPPVSPAGTPEQTENPSEIATISEQNIENEPVEQRPAALKNIRFITYETTPAAPPLTRAA